MHRSVANFHCLNLCKCADLEVFQQYKNFHGENAHLYGIFFSKYAYAQHCKLLHTVECG